MFYMNITSKYRLNAFSVQANDCKGGAGLHHLQFHREVFLFIYLFRFHALVRRWAPRSTTIRFICLLQIWPIMTSLYLFNGVYDNSIVKYEKLAAGEYTSDRSLLIITSGLKQSRLCIVLFVRHAGFWEKIKSRRWNPWFGWCFVRTGSAAESGALPVGQIAGLWYRHRISFVPEDDPQAMNPTHCKPPALIRINGGTAMMRKIRWVSSEDLYLRDYCGPSSCLQRKRVMDITGECSGLRT